MVSQYSASPVRYTTRDPVADLEVRGFNGNALEGGSIALRSLGTGLRRDRFRDLLVLSELTNLAFIFYATLLDTTILSAFLILIFYYFLWHIKKARPVSAIGFAVIFLLMYFTRSIFQWQWLLILALVLLLLKFPRRKLIVFLAITGVVIGLYTVKQVSLSDLSDTSAFTGLNLRHSIGCKGATEAYEKALLLLQPICLLTACRGVLSMISSFPPLFCRCCWLQ